MDSSEELSMKENFVNLGVKICVCFALLNTVIALNCKQKEQTNYEGIYTPLPTFLA
jgi:hypothetical protein